MRIPSNFVSQQGVGSVADANLNTFVQLVDTAPDLRNFTGLQNMTVVLLGNVTPADGLGGIYYFNSTSTSADNNATVIAPNGNPPTGRWLLVSLVGAVYLASFEFLGVPGNGAIVGQVTVPVGLGQITFKPNYAGSSGHASTAPTGTVNIAISNENATALGTMTITPPTTVTFSTPSSLPVTANGGDTLIFTGPNPADATLANFSATLIGFLGS